MDDKIIYVKRNIPKQLWREARASAVLEGKSVVEWVTEAIKEKLGRGELNRK